MVEMRAERYVRDVVTRLSSEMSGIGTALPGGRCGFVVFMLRPAVKQQSEWLNVQVLQSRLQQLVSEGDLFSLFAVLLMSHLTNLSIAATRNLFIEMGFNLPGESICTILTCTLTRFIPASAWPIAGGAVSMGLCARSDPVCRRI